MNGNGISMYCQCYRVGLARDLILEGAEIAIDYTQDLYLPF